MVAHGYVPTQLFIEMGASLHAKPCAGDPEGQLAQTPRSKGVTQTLNAISDALGRRQAASWSGNEGSHPTEELSEELTM